MSHAIPTPASKHSCHQLLPITRGWSQPNSQSHDQSTEDGQSNVPILSLLPTHEGAYLPTHSPTTNMVLAAKNVTAELDPQQPTSPDDSLPHEEHSSTDHARLINIVSQLSMAPPSKCQHLSKDNLALSYDEQALFNQLKSLAAEFQTVQSKPVEPLSEQSNSEIDFSTLQNIIDQQNCTHDGLSFEGIFNLGDPYAFAAGSQTNPDILTQSQMFKSEDQKKFIESQVHEIEGLVKAEVFKYLQMNELPQDACLLSAIWSYHQKHQPDSSLLKHKSCICVNGSKQQHRIDYWDTYSLVASVHWSTICMVLVLSTILGLKSHQVDYTQAFPQAPLDDPSRMDIQSISTENCSI